MKLFYPTTSFRKYTNGQKEVMLISAFFRKRDKFCDYFHVLSWRWRIQRSLIKFFLERNVKSIDVMYCTCLKWNTYISLFVFLQNNVQIFQCDSNWVQGCPVWISSMFISGCHWELFRRICASLNNGIIAVSLEMVQSPIKGYIMWIPKNVTGAGI